MFGRPIFHSTTPIFKYHFSRGFYGEVIKCYRSDFHLPSTCLSGSRCLCDHLHVMQMNALGSEGMVEAVLEHLRTCQDSDVDTKAPPLLDVMSYNTAINSCVVAKRVSFLKSLFALVTVKW